jgi:hypothetical protein
LLFLMLEPNRLHGQFRKAQQLSRNHDTSPKERKAPVPSNEALLLAECRRSPGS